MKLSDDAARGDDMTDSLTDQQLAEIEALRKVAEAARAFRDAVVVQTPEVDACIQIATLHSRPFRGAPHGPQLESLTDALAALKQTRHE